MGRANPTYRLRPDWSQNITPTGENMKLPFHRKRHVESSVEATNMLGDSLDWSQSPGAYERHLLRRYHNPYFPENRRQVTSADLTAAKVRDAEDMRCVAQRFKALKQDLNLLPDQVPSARIKELRKEMDDLASDALGIGGEALTIADAARKIRDGLVDILREAFKDDPENLAALKKAARFSKNDIQPFLESPFWAQVVRKDSPIDGSELISALITESPEDIAEAVEHCPANTTDLCKGSLALLLEAKDDGYVDESFDEKIAIFVHAAEPSADHGDKKTP